MRRTYSREFVSLLLVLALIAWVGSRVSAEPDPLPPFVTTTISQDALLQTLAVSPSRQFKPIGRTSVLFRMRTVSGVTAGYKVKSHGSETGYRSEIAAYRTSRLLLLDNVPPAVFRQAKRGEIRRRFHWDKLDRWDSVQRAIQWEDDGTVHGAASYWIKGARKGLESQRRAWQAWLRVEGVIPSDKTLLARDLSTMALFDFLVGNWDRHSGGNLLMNKGRTRALLVDNDRAFSILNEELYQRLLEDLTRTERFSKGVVDQLVVLDRNAIEHELARDSSHHSAPLLTDAQIDAFFDRRATILSYIAALVDEHGSDEVLIFP